MPSLPTELREVVFDLEACTRALGPYSEDAILIGGLVPLLYRIMFDAGSTARRPISTFDIDLVLPDPLSIRQSVLLHSRMLESDFIATESQTVRSGNPKVRYHHSRHGTSQLAPIHVEFLGPRTGSSTDRKGRDATFKEIQQGLIAELLPYITVLQFRPIVVDTSQLEGWKEASRPLRVPQPACYVVQKALVRDKRPTSEKRDKDAAQIYDVALLTREAWPQLAAVVNDLKKATIPPKWLRRAKACLHQMFQGESANGTEGVCRIYRDIVDAKHQPTAEAVFRAMSLFLSAVGLDHQT